MLKILQESRGITLVEVLISTALLSIVLLLITSFQIFGQNQVINQTSQIEATSNVRLALSDITKEIRMANMTDIDNLTVSNQELSFGNVTYILDAANNLLIKNNSPFVSNINHSESFFEKIEDGIKIKITSLPPKQGKSVSHTTEIHFRK